jgi:hypothetical protein
MTDEQTNAAERINYREVEQMVRLREALVFFFVSCVAGAALEWTYGTFWSLVGTSPWLYPHSFLTYTSLEVIPLWGFAGLMCMALYRAITLWRGRELFLLAISAILAALYVVLMANI